MEIGDTNQREANMAKTKIVTTNKNGKHKGKGKKFARRLTSKKHATHKGYSMKNIVKGQMTYKGKKKR
jgi:hypothetical protein